MRKRWPLQPLQPLQQTQLQPPFGQSVASLCHPWFTTTNVSYRFPIFETSATALCGTTGNVQYILTIFAACACSSKDFLHLFDYHSTAWGYGYSLTAANKASGTVRWWNLSRSCLETIKFCCCSSWAWSILSGPNPTTWQAISSDQPWKDSTNSWSQRKLKTATASG